MQKVVKFLEQNVQWMALGIGGLFFLYMVWAWVITPPAIATVGSQQLGPGEVDAAVDEKASQLIQLTNEKTADPNIPKTPRDNTNDFLMTMSNASAPPGKLQQMFVDSTFTPDQLDPKSAIQLKNPNQPQNPQNNNPVQNTKITALPSLPAAEIVGAGGGLSSIQPPVNPAVGAVAVVPTALGVNGQPLPLDKAWATVTFRLPTPEIAKSFAAVNVPAGTKSIVLQIEMVREEQQADGTWGPETPVRAIPLIGQVPYPSGGPSGLSMAYKAWAEGHEGDILQPTFYTVLAGAPWLPPGMPTVAAAQQTAAFDPATYTGPMEGLTPEQHKAVMDARRQKAIEKAKSAPKPAPRGAPGGRGRPGAAGGDPVGAIKSTDVYLAPPPRPFNPQSVLADNPVGDNPDMGNPNGGGGGAPPPPGLTPEAQQMLQKHPTSSFDPADPLYLGGIICWAHDDNVEAGKTYRYKVRYKMLNPGYVQPGMFVNTKLALQFDVTSADTAWTQPVDIPAQTTFYVSRNPLTSGVPFDVYHWQNGQLRAKSITVAVGDMIGTPDGDTDYTTGWTVADIRSDPRGGSPYVLLVDNAGKTIRRDFSTDIKDPKYITFKAQAAANKAAAPQPGGPGYGAAAGG